MRKQKDLSGERFGSLTVLEKAEGLSDRYYTWHCRCDCGNEIVVNTKNLTSHRKTHCGCKPRKPRNSNLMTKDRTGEKHGALTVERMAGKNDKGELLWECGCECGNRITVSAMLLKQETVKDCGCGRSKEPKYKDLAGKRKGQLTALYSTDKRDGKGCVIWRCRCDCGNEIEMSESDFVFGHSVSCGCVRQQRLDECHLSDYLTFVDGTCVEVLSKRKKRSDNSSGFRGVYKYGDASYRVIIGLQGKKYNLGRYATFDEAVSVRIAVEEFLHEGFVSCYEKWQAKAAADALWAARNPFYFNVDKDERTFRIESTVTEQKEYQY